MYLRLSIAASFALTLAACGGGSSGGTATPPPAAPAAPLNVTASAWDNYVLIDGSAVAGATAYNIYWSNTSGVSPTVNSGVIPVTSTPQAHTGLTNGKTYYYVVTALNGPSESAPSLQKVATPVSAVAVADPLFADQWHLLNTSQPGAAPTLTPAKSGEDIRAQPAWFSSKGAGVTIAIVDDGLEMGHPDLASNMAANGKSHNYVTGSSDPTNDPTDTTSGHGTECAGIAASRDQNGLGGSGVAPRATLVGYNLLLASTVANQADAMILNASTVGVSSNSWGAPDGTGELTAGLSTWKAAVDTGLVSGRGGKGTVYVWAAGNGRAGSATACPAWICSDDSNYDGLANYRGVMAVGAVNDQGLQSSYSESGANLWVAAPGGEYCTTHAITTTDRTGAVGHNNGAIAGDYLDPNYTKCMNGTSAATPGVAGVAALVLAANPALTWRDVRIILAQSARMNDAGTCTTVPVAPAPCPASNTGWILNGTAAAPATNPRYYFNHKYGFGVVDADLAVKIATGAVAGAGQVAGVPWANVGPEKTYTSALTSPVNPVITDPTTAVPAPAPTTSTITVPASPGGITSLEWVEVTFTAVEPFTGDLDVALTSPSGMVSQLAVGHLCAGASGACTSSYTGWVFGSAAHLGEAPAGNWTLTVKDMSAGGGNGTFSSWQLKLYGH